MALVQFVDDSAPYLNADNLNKIQEGNVYSTSEIEIGKWIDGKPIYRKVYTTYTTTTGATGTDIILDNSFTNKTLINAYGTVQLKSGASSWNVCVGTADTGFGAFSAVSQAFRTNMLFLNRITSPYGTLDGVNIIVEYTKTTD